MKKEKFNFGSALSHSELKKIMAGSDSDTGTCNCLYCYWSDGGITTYAADCDTNPPNPMRTCTFLGWPRIPSKANYGLC